MDPFIKILNILAWPFTTIVLVSMLKTPISELIASIRKLKYRELEIEFDQEARSIRADAERDIRKPRMARRVRTTDSAIMFSRQTLEPKETILNSGQELEEFLRGLAGDEMLGSFSSVVRDLEDSGKLAPETAKVVLRLATLRNKAYHSDPNIISRDAASDFCATVSRVMSSLSEDQVDEVTS